MSNIIGNLLSNAQALNVHTLGAEIAGKNLANVNDPAYARQRILLDEGGNYKAGQHTHSLGLNALGIEHIRNSILDSQIMREGMQSASLETQADLMQLLETNMNEILDRNGAIEGLDGNAQDFEAGGISKAIDDFLNSWSELSSAPENEALKDIVLQRADALIEEFQIAAERLEEMDELIADQVTTDVSEANIVLSKIADLNARIARFETQPGLIAPDLRDERQAAIEELAEYIDFEVTESGQNPAMIDINLKVLNTPASSVSSPIALISGGNVTGELVYTANITDPLTGATTKVDKLYYRQKSDTLIDDKQVVTDGGSIHGALKVKTNNLLHLQSDFDTLASNLVANVNTAYQGTPADATNIFFDAAGTTAATIDFDASLFTEETLDGQLVSFLDPTKVKTTNDAGGGNDIALAIGQLVDTKLIGVDATIENSGYSFREYIANFGTRVGAEHQTVLNNLSNQEIVDNYLQQQRESHSGVSIDEEMTDLLRFQRAFQGTSRVINVLDNMLEQVVVGLVR